MNDIRLADGCPVWEGAAVVSRFKSMQSGVPYYVHDVLDGGRVDIGLGRVELAPGLVLDLTHRPTFLELAARVAALDFDENTWLLSPSMAERWPDDWEVGHIEAPSTSFRYECPSAHESLKALWRQVDPRGK
jgi:hypothetical protein